MAEQESESSTADKADDAHAAVGSNASGAKNEGASLALESESSEPGAKSSEPSKPGAESSESSESSEPSKPGAESSESSESSEPGAESSKPGAESSEPGAESSKPSEPGAESSKPGAESSESSEPGPEDDVPMSFFDHLSELRKRLVRSALGIVVAFAVCYVFVDSLRTVVLVPFHESWQSVGLEGKAELQALSALETFLTDLRIAIIAAIFVAGPIVFYQLWMFIAPGLYRSERNLVVPFVATSAVMFLGGGVFCYYFVVPVATDFFLKYSLDTAGGSEGVSIVPRFTYESYVQYETRLLLGFGAMFEFPLGIFFLAKAGIITHKHLLRHWKVMVLVFFVLGALLTPPEPITQILMAAPMIALYFASVGVAYIVGKDERERVAKLEAELAAEEAKETAEDEGDAYDDGLG